MRVLGLESGTFRAFHRPEALRFRAVWRLWRARAKGDCRFGEMNRTEGDIGFGSHYLEWGGARASTNATAMFNHRNVRISERIDRVLRRFVVTPDMHRVHHSIEEDEANSNFGFPMGAGSTPSWVTACTNISDDSHRPGPERLRGGHNGSIVMGAEPPNKRMKLTSAGRPAGPALAAYLRFIR